MLAVQRSRRSSGGRRSPDVPPSVPGTTHQTLKKKPQYVSDNEEEEELLLSDVVVVKNNYNHASTSSTLEMEDSMQSMMSLTDGEETDFDASGLDDDSLVELPALVEDEVVEEPELPDFVDEEEEETDLEEVAPPVPFVLQVDRAIGHADAIISGEDNAATMAATSPKERRRSSKRSSLRQDDNNSGSGDDDLMGETSQRSASSRRRRRSARSSLSRSRTSDAVVAAGDNDGDLLMGDSSQRSTASRRRRSSGTLSRTSSRTCDSRVVGSNTGLAAMKNALMGSGSAAGGPTMRRPSRKKSGEYTATPTKRRPSRKKSNDAKGALRRNRSSISRQASNSSALSRMSRMLRRPPSRQNTSDGTSNAVLRRTQTTEATATQQPSSNGSLRRSRTSDERALPKRNFSARLPSRSKSSKSGHKRPSRTSSLKPPPPTSLNIFGSDIVSTDFILSQLDELEQNTDIVQVEMEDCLVTQRALAIPLRLKEVLQGEIRPWETIQFVDELLDGVSQYKDFKRSRKHFHKALGGVCAQKVIPVSYKVKVHVREEDNADDADMVDLLQQFQKDVTVTTLHVNTTKASLALIQSLTALLQCDERVWDGENMQWQVSCNEPQPAEVVAAGGLEQWQAAMKTAMKKLQKVAVAKEIVMS